MASLESHHIAHLSIRTEKTVTMSTTTTEARSADFKSTAAISGTIDSLPTDVMKQIFSYVGKGNYYSIGPVSKNFCYDYLTMDIADTGHQHKIDVHLKMQANKITSVEAASTSVSLAEIFLLDVKNGAKIRWELCKRASEKNRIDIIEMAFTLGIDALNLGIDDTVELEYDSYSKILQSIIKKGEDTSKILNGLKRWEGVDFQEFCNCNFEIIFDMTVTYDYLDTFKWFHSEFMLHRYSRKEYFKDLVKKAVEHGNVDLIKWIYETRTFNGQVIIETNEEMEELFNPQKVFFPAAALSGHLDIIRWGVNDAEFQFDALDFIHHAAQSGNLDLFQWVKDRITHLTTRHKSNTFTCALKSGNVQLLEYLQEDGWCEMNPPYWRFYNHAIINIDDDEKALAVVRWLHQECQLDIQSLHLGNTAGRGHLEVLIYARRNGSLYEGDPICWAIEQESRSETKSEKRVAVIKYCLQDIECPRPNITCSFVLEKFEDNERAFEMLQLLGRYGVDWGEEACTKAIRKGNVDALKLAKSYNCPWTQNTCAEIVRHGDIELLQWALDNDCPLSLSEETFSAALLSRDIAIVQYCIKQNCPFAESLWPCQYWDDPISILRLLIQNGYELTEATCAEAAQWGDSRVLRWLRYIGCPWDERTLSNAVRDGKYENVVFAHENGCTLTEEIFAYCFSHFGLRGLADRQYHYPCWEHSGILNYLLYNNCPQPSNWKWNARRGCIEFSNGE